MEIFSGTRMSGSPASITADIIAKAESYRGIRAGIVRLENLLKAPSYLVPQTRIWTINSSEDARESWIEAARSVLVLGFNHPAHNQRLDWFDRGNTEGNQKLMKIIDSLKAWVQKTYGLEAQPLPYFLEQGGIFLKDAAVLAGLGIIGDNNLLITQEWGPRIRFRAMLITGELQPSPPIEKFTPCKTCNRICQKACPRKAFSKGAYSRSTCLVQLDSDRANRLPVGKVDRAGNPVLVVKWCRECELVCPAGS
jgi:epoxyqueuosine reductase